MNISRRRFFLSTLATSLAPLMIPPAQARENAGESRLRSEPLDLFIFDDRFDEATSLAFKVAREGISVRSVQGDVTRLWYDDLYYRWQNKPGAVGGITTINALFCLETLGADAGLRTAKSSLPTHSGLLNDHGQPLQQPPLVRWLLAPAPSRSSVG